MTEHYLQKFVDLIAARTGLHTRDKDRSSLAQTLEARIDDSGLLRAEIYLHHLEAASAQSDEWKFLMPRLTNGESYFLRDKGQFNLLRTRIVPDLLRQRESRRTLRIWSAGCSTGEEAYSLAMLCDELVPRNDGWNVSILGTDINEESLARARRGAYGAWAFRTLDPELRLRYFSNDAEVNATLRRDVSFSALNLRGGDWPSRATGVFDMDLILCRNVLIYFRPDAIAHALAQFAATLRDGGYLLTGHAEIAGHNPAPLLPRVFSESVAYQRSDRAAAPSKPAQPLRAQPKSAQSKSQTLEEPNRVRANSTLLLPLPANTTKPNAQAANAQAAPAKSGESGGANAVAMLCASARAFADVGQYADAIHCCREAVALDSVAAGAYFVWAQVETETGARESAKALFKKVIYLAPSQPEAYLELAALYEVENDAARARKMRQTALAPGARSCARRDDVVFSGARRGCRALYRIAASAGKNADQGQPMTTALASMLAPAALALPDGEAASYLLCVVRGSLYGVVALAVREIVPLPEITRVGEMPRETEGVVDVRGRIVPVFDIAAALGLESQPPHLGDALVVLERDGELCAFVADALRDVRTIAVSGAHPPGELVAGLAQIEGIAGGSEGGIAQVLRLDAFFERTAGAVRSPEAAGPEAAGQKTTVLPHRFAALSAEERAVFQARAVSLSRSAEAGIAAEQTLPLAAVKLGGEYFGFSLDLVREFAPLRSFTFVPFAPAPVIGLANLRGETLTLVDLRFALHLPAPADWKNSQIVVVESDGLRVGIVVDVVLDVFMAPLPLISASTRDENLRGTVAYREHMMGILDVARVLDAIA
jgi:chemotaxis protein methyltransferase CheR